MKSKKQQYKIIIEQDEDGYFIATVPELPGCYTQAKTIPVLKKRIREVIELCLEQANNNAQYRKQIKKYGYTPSFVGLELISL